MAAPDGGEPPAQTSLARARDAWQRAQHRTPGDCQHPRTAIYKDRNADGTWRVITACAVCETEIGGGHNIAHRHVELDTLPLRRDGLYTNPPCQVCGAFGTQLHHWAPKAIFGATEADHWPTSWLCVTCHTEWHKRIADHHPAAHTASDDPGRPF